MGEAYGGDGELSRGSEFLEDPRLLCLPGGEGLPTLVLLFLIILLGNLKSPQETKKKKKDNL